MSFGKAAWFRSSFAFVFLAHVDETKMARLGTRVWIEWVLLNLNIADLPTRTKQGALCPVLDVGGKQVQFKFSDSSKPFELVRRF
jgi:hypothetical protein